VLGTAKARSGLIAFDRQRRSHSPATTERAEAGRVGESHKAVTRHVLLTYLDLFNHSAHLLPQPRLVETTHYGNRDIFILSQTLLTTICCSVLLGGYLV
jgi:hypothetical protein